MLASPRSRGCSEGRKKRGEDRRRGSTLRESEPIHKVNLPRDAVKNRFHPAKGWGEVGFSGADQSRSRAERKTDISSRVACIHPAGHRLYVNADVRGQDEAGSTLRKISFRLLHGLTPKTRAADL